MIEFFHRKDKPFFECICCNFEKKESFYHEVYVRDNNKDSKDRIFIFCDKCYKKLKSDKMKKMKSFLSKYYKINGEIIMQKSKEVC